MNLQRDGMQPIQPPCITRRKPLIRKYSLWQRWFALARHLEIRVTRWIDEVWFPRAYERMTGKTGDRVCAVALLVIAAIFAAYMAEWGMRGFPR